MGVLRGVRGFVQYAQPPASTARGSWSSRPGRGRLKRELRSPSRTYFSHKRLRSVPSDLPDNAVLVGEVRPRSRLSGTKGPNLPVLLDLLNSLISLTQSPDVWPVSVGWRGELAQAGRVRQKRAAVTHRPMPKGTTVTDLRNRPAHRNCRPSVVPVFGVP